MFLLVEYPERRSNFFWNEFLILFLLGGRQGGFKGGIGARLPLAWPARAAPNLFLVFAERALFPDCLITAVLSIFWNFFG